MEQPTSVATLLCSSVLARSRAVWSSVLRVDDRVWYHEHCYYEIRGLTPLADDPLQAEAEAVVAGLSQAVNAHGLTKATLWITQPLLLEAAQRAVALPSGVISGSTSDEEEDDDDACQQKYEQVLQEIPHVLQGNWMHQCSNQQRKYLQDFLAQLVLTRGQAVIEWRLLSENRDENLPASVREDSRRARELSQELLVTDSLERLNPMVFGKIVDGQIMERERVDDIPDLIGLEAMILKDTPDSLLLQPGPLSTQVPRKHQTKQALPSHMTHFPWVYAHAPSYPERMPADEKARGGHWRFYVSRDVVDEVWGKIVLAVEQGQCGPVARVSTASAAHSFKHQEHQINVFSSDSHNEADVKRIREVLRGLGILWPIAYKGHGPRPLDLPQIPGHDLFTFYVD